VHDDTKNAEPLAPEQKLAPLLREALHNDVLERGPQLVPLASPTSRSASPDACRESEAAAFRASDPRNERLCWCWSASTPLRP